MALFARPAVWSYDLPLFRQGMADEWELEGLLAATVLEQEAVWVVESDEQPAAFAWGRWEAEELRLVRFYLAPHPAADAIGRVLLARIAKDNGGGSGDLAAIETALTDAAETLAVQGWDWAAPRNPSAA